MYQLYLNKIFKKNPVYGLSIELNFFCLWPLSLFSVVLSICYVTVAFLVLQHAYVELVKLSSKKNGANFNTATLLKKNVFFGLKL